MLRLLGGFCVIIERGGRCGEKTEKLVLPFPYQKDRRRRAACECSELPLHLKESGERGAYLLHLPNWGEPRYSTAVVNLVIVNRSYHL